MLITKDRKEIVHSVQNLSSESHIAIFLAEKIKEVINNVGKYKFVAIVSDHAAACATAKKIVAEHYQHIIPI